MYLSIHKLLFLLLSFICFKTTLFPQCLNSSQVWDEFRFITTLSTKEKIIKFKLLQRQRINCQLTSDSCYTNLLFLFADAEYGNKNKKKAIELSSEAIRIAELYPKKNSKNLLAKYYFYCGYYHEKNNQFNKAIIYYKKSAEAGKPFKKRWDIVAQSYQYLAYNCYKYGDYHREVDYATLGLMYASKAKDTLAIMSNIYEKSRGLYLLGKLDEANTQLNKIFSINFSSTTFYEKGLFNKLQADIFFSKNDYNTAIKYYQKAYTFFESSKNSEEIGGICTDLHFIYIKKKDFFTAEKYFFLAIKNTENPLYISRLYNNSAWYHSRNKNFKKAFIDYQNCLNTLPIVFKNKRKEANPSSDKIKIISEKDYLLSPIQDKADTWLDYYKATNTKSHLTNALKTYALADSMIDFMRYEHVGEGSKLFWRQKTRGMYERAIEASYLAGDAEAAFRFFEKSKAVLLSDKLNELGANQQLTESSAKRQRTLRDSIANLQNQLASLPANDAKRSGIQRRLEQFNDDFEAFRKQLESTNPAYYRYKYDNSTPTIAEFQKSISTNGSGARTVGFVSYFVGDSAIYAFCLDQKARLVRLSLRPSDYQSLANEFLSLCADRSRLNAHYPQYRALAHRLYQLLWKPLGMTASRVIISQDGVFLPFETLLVQPNQNDFLLKHHAISYTYSANFLAKNQTDLAPSLHQGDKLFHRSFVGFAPETFQPSLRQASLKGSVAALEAVEEKFWWGKTLKNNEATKAQFMRYAPNSRVIQLFTHADADSTEAVEPRIYFHDAALRLSELTQADRFAAQLLVLSACKTGVGQNQRGEGVFSLARGFAALGIPSTITTLWSVEDQPTYELTKLFYNYLDQGLPKDEALQRAKLDWLNQGDAADALPSQWAGMILVGDTAPLAMDGLRFIILGLGLLGLGVLGGVWWWRRKKISLFPFCSIIATN